MYDDISSELLQLCEDILWNRDPEATDKLLTYAENHSTDASLIVNTKDLLWRDWPVEERIKHSLVKVLTLFFLNLKKDVLATVIKKSLDAQWSGFECHLNPGHHDHLNSRQMDAMLFSYYWSCI